MIGSKTYAPTTSCTSRARRGPAALRGMGVLETHLNGTFVAVERAGPAGAQPLRLGHPDRRADRRGHRGPEPLDAAEAAKVKSGWLRSQRDRTVAVLNSRTKFEALAWNPTETQLLEARRFSLHEIALIFGLDPSWLGVASKSMTYSNVESEAINLVKFSLGGHLARFEQTFSLHMPRGTVARANLDAILRADTKTRYEAHALAIQTGFLTRDEVRGLEHRPPLTPAQRADLPSVDSPPAAPDPTEERAKGGKGNAAELRRYWTESAEGLAKWASLPKPWTALYGHLRKYLKNDEAAKALTTSYYKAVFGHAPGDD
jgi:hypothetical protein